MAGLMRALRGVATGYMGARVDMMAEKSKREREDEIRAAEEAFELNKLDDKYRLETAMRLKLLEEEQGYKTKKELEKEAEELKERREFFSSQGYTKPMLDVLEMQGYLNSDAAFGVFFNKYDTEMKNLLKGDYTVDWHMEEDANGNTFQDQYVTHWQEYILGQGTNGFKLDWKDSINDSLNKNNDVPPNSADVLTKTPNEIEAQTSGQTVETKVEGTEVPEVPMIPGPIVGVIDKELPAEIPKEKELITNNHYLSGFNKPALIPIIHIFDKHDENWALTDMNPGALQEGQMLTLTLNSNGTGYTTKFTKVSDTFEEVRQGVTDRDKELNTAIYNNKGLFSEIEDLNVFVQGGGKVDEFFAKNAANQKLYVQLFSYATLLDRSFASEKIPMSAQEIAQRAVRLVGKTNDTAANQWAALVLEQEPDSDAFFNKALEAVNYAEQAIRYATQGLDKETKEGQMLIARIQDKVFTNFKHRFATFNLLESERGATQATNPKYETALRLFNEIIHDKQKGPDGNKGKFWETRKEIYEETQPARELANTKGPQLGAMDVDEEKALMKQFEDKLDPTKARGIAVPLDKLRGTPTVTATDTSDTGGETTGTIPSSIKDGVTIYDLSDLPTGKGEIEKLTKVDWTGTRDANKKSTEQTGYTYIFKDGSTKVFQPGDIFNDGRGNKIVNIASYGEKGNRGLIIQPYSGSRQTNPNKVLLDSKIKQLNKVEKTPMPKRHVAGMTDEKWLKNKETKITTLKQEIEELYNKIKG